jgi:hypothetical protein
MPARARSAVLESGDRMTAAEIASVAALSASNQAPGCSGTGLRTGR